MHYENKVTALGGKDEYLTVFVPTSHFSLNNHVCKKKLIELLHKKIITDVESLMYCEYIINLYISIYRSTTITIFTLG